MNILLKYLLPVGMITKNSTPEQNHDRIAPHFKTFAIRWFFIFCFEILIKIWVVGDIEPSTISNQLINALIAIILIAPASLAIVFFTLHRFYLLEK